MRKLATITFLTLDGVMQAPGQAEEDRSGGFDRGGWAQPWWEEVMQQVWDEAMSMPYDLVLGRKTYQLFAPHFSGAGATGKEADRLNNAAKYVASNSAGEFTWKHTQVLRGNPTDKLRELKEGQGPLLQIHGSWALIQSLLKEDLIDEFRLWTFPIIVGGGKRLFADGTPPSNLELCKTAATSNGVVMAVYRRQSGPIGSQRP